MKNEKMKIAVGVVTSPRVKPTLKRTLQALKFAYEIPHVHIFAEPQTDVPKFEGQTIHQHEEKLGCFKNFDFAHRWLIENTDADFILVLPDDMKFKSDFFKQTLKLIDKIDRDRFGYLALYTPRGMNQFFPNNPQHEMVKINRKWGDGGWGGCYLMNRGIARLITETDFYLDHKENYKQNQQFDECIKQVCFDLKLNQWYLNPSLFDHVGETSTIGHQFRPMDKGLNYGKSF